MLGQVNKSMPSTWESTRCRVGGLVLALLLQCGKAITHPAFYPRFASAGRKFANRLKHPQIAERMNVAGDQRGHCSDDCTIVRASGQQRRVRILLVQPFDNR